MHIFGCARNTPIKIYIAINGTGTETVTTPQSIHKRQQIFSIGFGSPGLREGDLVFHCIAYHPGPFAARIFSSLEQAHRFFGAESDEARMPNMSARVCVIAVVSSCSAFGMKYCTTTPRKRCWDETPIEAPLIELLY